MRTLRVYFTMFSNDEYRALINEMRRICGEIREHTSRVVEEFRFVEIPEPTEECQENIKELLEKHGAVYPKIDLISPD